MMACYYFCVALSRWHDPPTPPTLLSSGPERRKSTTQEDVIYSLSFPKARFVEHFSYFLYLAQCFLSFLYSRLSIFRKGGGRHGGLQVHWGVSTLPSFFLLQYPRVPPPTQEPGPAQGFLLSKETTDAYPGVRVCYNVMTQMDVMHKWMSCTVVLVVVIGGRRGVFGAIFLHIQDVGYSRLTGRLVRLVAPEHVPKVSVPSMASGSPGPHNSPIRTLCMRIRL